MKARKGKGEAKARQRQGKGEVKARQGEADVRVRVKMRRRIATRLSVEEANRALRKTVTVRVPATSVNVGPGCESFSVISPSTLYIDRFSAVLVDCLGMAVDLWTEVTVERADKFEIIATGEGAELIPKDESNHLVTGVKAAFLTAGKDMPTLKYTIVSRIPFARGFQLI